MGAVAYSGMGRHFHLLVGRVSDVHFGLVTLHDLVGVTAGAKHRHAITKLAKTSFTPVRK